MKDLVVYTPIRLNSKRLPRKSVKDFGGRPLFCWSLEKLDSMGYPVYVYTNDKIEDYLDFKPLNVSFLERPKRLSEDSTLGIDIYKSFKDQVPAKNYLLTHCTSPFVKTETYDKIIHAVLKEGYDSSFTVCEIKSFCWYENSPLNFTLPRPKTQDLKPVSVETSAAYCYKSEVINKGARSGSRCKRINTNQIESIDIDDENDFKLAKCLLNANII